MAFRGMDCRCAVQGSRGARQPWARWLHRQVRAGVTDGPVTFWCSKQIVIGLLHRSCCWWGWWRGPGERSGEYGIFLFFMLRSCVFFEPTSYAGRWWHRWWWGGQNCSGIDRAWAWLTSGIERCKPTAQSQGLSSQGLPSRESLMSCHLFQSFLHCVGGIWLNNLQGQEGASSHMFIASCVPKHLAEHHCGSFRWMKTRALRTTMTSHTHRSGQNAISDHMRFYRFLNTRACNKPFSGQALCERSWTNTFRI
jgi:hypothetical protein